MADRTPRFGFTTFDNSADTLALHGHKAFGADRVQLDQLLTVAVERHRHNGAVVTNTPPTTPTLQLSATGGMLPPNQAVHYRTSIVDARGQEHVASQTAVAYTASQLLAPWAPTIVGRGTGSLLPGDYLYAVSAYTASNDRETLTSPVATGNLTEPGGLALQMPHPPSAADGWNLYRKGPTDYEPMWIVALPVDTSTYQDTGAALASRTRGMPARNTTSSSSSITVDRPDGLGAGETIKIYRTFDPTNWEKSLLVWAGQLPYIDTGHPTREGYPPDVSPGAGGAPRIHLDTHAIGNPPPGLTNTTTQINFAFLGPVVAGIGPWQWINEYDQLRLLRMHINLGRGSTPADQPVIVALDGRSPAGGSWQRFQTGGFDITAEIAVGDFTGTSPAFDLTGLPTPLLQPGGALRAVILQDGGGDTPTDENLAITITAAVKHGSVTATYTWET